MEPGSFVIGIAGAGLLLLAYYCNARHLCNADVMWYHVLNAVGSGLLVYYACHPGAYAVAILNAVWFVVALSGIIRIYRAKPKTQGG